MILKLPDLLTRVDGTLLAGDSECEIRGFASLLDAEPGDLSLFSNHRYREQLSATRASVVLVPKTWSDFPGTVTCIGVADPSRAFDQLVDALGLQPEQFQSYIHPTAAIADSAKLDRCAVAIGACAVIDEGAEIADGVEIGAGCYVGKSARIGAGSRLFANATVHDRCVLGQRVILHSGVVIGADGFGYEFEKGRHRKVRQLGSVQIDDDVEIGAGSMVDRGRIGRTRIGAGTKIDNLVQIGHNVVIGKHCILVSGVAIAGSAVIGDYVVMAAGAGIAGHVNVGAQSTIGGRAGVTKDVLAGTSVLGFPAVPAREERRRIGSIARLPQLLARVKELEARLVELEPQPLLAGMDA
ncbi:MAG: UDP-3-O-(3-hydroxymyristoyl)glucosamine N-acyltransferase [Chthoniobacteraceae bacterium]